MEASCIMTQRAAIDGQLLKFNTLLTPGELWFSTGKKIHATFLRGWVLDRLSIFDIFDEGIALNRIYGMSLSWSLWFQTRNVVMFFLACFKGSTEGSFGPSSPLFVHLTHSWRHFLLFLWCTNTRHVWLLHLNWKPPKGCPYMSGCFTVECFTPSLVGKTHDGSHGTGTHLKPLPLITTVGWFI